MTICDNHRHDITASDCIGCRWVIVWGVYNLIPAGDGDGGDGDQQAINQHGQPDSQRAKEPDIETARLSVVRAIPAHDVY